MLTKPLNELNKGHNLGFMDEPQQIGEDFVQLARLALNGRSQDVAVYLRRAIRRYRVTRPDIAEVLMDLLRQTPIRASVLKSAPATDFGAPVDANSRLQLVRQE